MSSEKKKTIIITVILALIATILIVIFVINNLKQSGTIASSDQKEIMDNFDKYFNSKDRTIIYYASSECSWCEIQTPILETIAEDYDLDYYYLDSSKLGSKQRRTILDKLGIEHATPTTIIVEDGEVIDTAQGYYPGQEYVEFFKDNDMLEDDAIYSAEQYITFIDYDEYTDLISNQDTHVIVIGQTTCSHCIAIKPALNQVAGQYNLTINYLNITDMTEEENNLFFESLTTIGYDDEDFLNDGSFGTPLILIVKDGKVISYISGERTTSQLVREFKKLDLISE